MVTTDIPPNPMGVAVVSISAVGLAIDIVFIGLRFWARKLKKHKLEVSDFLIVAAWLVAFGDLIRKIYAMRWGVGVHFMDLYAKAPENIIPAFKISWAGYFAWGACILLIKLSILFLYRSLFRYVEGFILAVYITMGCCVAVFLAFVSGLLTQCHPIAYQWDKTIPGGKCGLSSKGGFIISGSLNLVLDVVLVVLPIPIVWKLHNVSYMKKLGICAMFGLGTIICILVGVRFKLVMDTNEMDFTHDGEPPGIFSSLELYLGMVSACLPLVSPALLSIREKTQSSYIFGLLSRRSRSRSATNSKASSSRDGASEKSGRSSDGSGSRGNAAVVQVPEQNEGEFPLKSWPAYAREYNIESSPWGKNQVDHEIRFQSDWDVRSERVREQDPAKVV